MPLTVACPGCRTPYSVKDEHRGKSLRCVRCQMVFSAQEPAPSTTAVTPTAPRPAPVPPPAPSQALQATLPTNVIPLSSDNPFRDIEDSKADTKQLVREPKKSVLQRVLPVVRWCGRQALAATRQAVRLFLALPRKAQIGVGAGLAILIGLLALLGMLGVFSSKKDVTVAATDNTKQADQPPSTEPRERPSAVENGQLVKAVREKVEKATVRIIARRSDGGATGSGFFALQKGIVLTNAHVIGMLDAESRAPETLQVILNSGENDETKLDAIVRAVDRENDLAVLKISDAKVGKLPPPLTVHSAATLEKTQQLWVFGFPKPDLLGEELSISKATVRTLRMKNKVIAKVELDGGMQPGNSGGPVVDHHGDVVGVAVSIIRGTTINNAVPGDYVTALLNGNCSNPTLGQPYSEGGKARVPVTMARTDPLGRLAEVAVDVWAGKKDQPRPAVSATPVRMPGDSEHVKTLLTGRDAEAAGDVVLPPLPDGQVYWVQPRWKNDGGDHRWGPAHVWEMKSPPVERKPADLTIKYATGDRPLALNWKCATNFNGKRDKALESTLKSELTETIRGIDGEGSARVRWKYRSFDHKVTFDGESIPVRYFDVIGQSMPAATVNVELDATGKMTRQNSDIANIPEALREALLETNKEVVGTLKVLSIPMPNRMTRSLETWEQPKLELPLFTGIDFERSDLDMTYTYLGTRVRGGRPEAVIGLSGKIKGPWNRPESIGGRLSGTAVLDLNSGQISAVDSHVSYTIERFDYQLQGNLELQLQRTVGR